MPAFDGTGPAGMGPMTGWGRGYCSFSTAPHQARGLWPAGVRGLVSGFNAFTGRATGRGRWFSGGMGFSRGRGAGRRFCGRGGYVPSPW